MTNIIQTEIARIYKAEAGRVLAHLVRILGSFDLAEEATQEAFSIALEKWQDVRIAGRYLIMLIEEFPDSELIEDAQFLLDNLNNPRVLNPQSIDDLRGN